MAGVFDFKGFDSKVFNTGQTADADHLMIIEGFFVATGTGDLQIQLQAESAGLVCRAMQGSFLELKKLS